MAPEVEFTHGVGYVNAGSGAVLFNGTQGSGAGIQPPSGDDTTTITIPLEARHV